MNAYELADELDAIFTKGDWEEIPNVVAMLRQQADRIAELEKNLDIAIMTTKADADRIAELEMTLAKEFSFKKAGYETLHIHPVKQLSDERIEAIFLSETGFPFDTDAKVDEVAMLDFARAIIKEITE